MKKPEVKNIDEIKPDIIVTKENEKTDNEVLTKKLNEVINDEIINDKIENNIEQKKRGRPRKTEVNEPVKPIAVIPLSPILDILIIRLPNPIPLSEMEKTLINESGNKLIEKYSTNIKYLEEIQFSILLFGVLFPRLKSKPDEQTKTD